jgi:hypothetical protein
VLPERVHVPRARVEDLSDSTPHEVLGLWDFRRHLREHGSSSGAVAASPAGRVTRGRPGRAKGMRIERRCVGMAALVVALVVTLLIIVWLVASRVSYQAHHKYTDADLKGAREDSVSRSRSVVSGKVQEHLAPLFPEFISQFNPRDAIFLGTPLDFVVFDGLNDGDDTEVRRVVFVEVKTGKASLIKRERRVRDAIQAGRVERGASLKVCTLGVDAQVWTPQAVRYRSRSGPMTGRVFAFRRARK